MRKERSIYQTHQLHLSATTVCPHAFMRMSWFYVMRVIDVNYACVLMHCCVRTYAISEWGDRHLSPTGFAWGRTPVKMRTHAWQNEETNIYHQHILREDGHQSKWGHMQVGMRTPTSITSRFCVRTDTNQNEDTYMSEWGDQHLWYTSCT